MNARKSILAALGYAFLIIAAGLVVYGATTGIGLMLGGSTALGVLAVVLGAASGLCAWIPGSFALKHARGQVLPLNSEQSSLSIVNRGGHG